MSISSNIRSYILGDPDRFVLLSTLCLSLISLIGVAFYIDTLLALLGGYVVIGLLLAVATNELYERHFQREKKSREVKDFKKTIIIIFLTISAVALTGERLVPLLVGVPVAYYLILRQIDQRVSQVWIIACVVSMFAFIALSRFFATGFFFGGTDIFIYLPAVEKIIKVGSLSVLERKKYYPLYHVLLGSISSLTGLGTYESLMLTGMILFSGVCVGINLFSRSLTSNTQVSQVVMIGFSSLPVTSYFAAYLIPFSLGVAFLVFIAFVIARYNTGNQIATRRFVIIGLTLIVGVTLTHNQSVFLFSVLLIGLLFFQQFPLIRGTSTVNVTIVLLLVIISGGYWVFVDEQFVVATALLGSQRAANFAQNLVTSTEVTGSIYILGEVAIQNGPSSRLLWFVTPNGLFQISLVSLIALGFITRYNETQLVERINHVHVMGFLCSALMLRTVLSIPGLFRFRMITAPFFAFVLGIAIYAYYLRNENAVSRGIVILLVLVAGICGPLVVASDIDEVQPDVTYPAKNSLNTSEYEGIRAVADVTRPDQEVSSLHIENRALERFGALTRTPSVAEDRIRIGKGLFLYRHEWTEYRAAYRPPESVSTRSVFVSKQWLQTAIASENKVFTTGSVGLTWDDSPYTLTDRRWCCPEGGV